MKLQLTDIKELELTFLTCILLVQIQAAWNIIIECIHNSLGALENSKDGHEAPEMRGSQRYCH